MKRRHVWMPLAALASPSWASTETDPDAAFAALAQRYFEDKMALDPVNASATVGGAQYEGLLAITIAPEEIARARALNERVAAELRALPAERLSPAARLSHRLLADEVQLGIAGDRFPGHLMPADQFGGVPLMLANLGGGDQAQPLKTPQDYDHYLQRLRRLPDWNRQAIANMREGMARGITVPRALIDSALPTLRHLAEPDIGRSPFGAVIRAIPAEWPERARLAAAYAQAFSQEILPAMQALVAFLETSYRPACRSSAGLSALPDGEAWYAHLVRFHTGTALPPEDIHALGMAEVARIRAEMSKLQRRFGVGGRLTDFLKWQASAPRFHPYRDWRSLLAAYTQLNARIAPRLKQLFGRLPRQPLLVREMPALQRASMSPYYNAPAPDGSRPGIFFVGAPEGPRKFNSAIVSTLLLHEGQPGHHFQVCLQYEQAALPAFRKYGWSTAFGEGWALYAETLGHELGLYGDPGQYLGHLKLELLRAVRLVADTGLHAKGWSREQAMRYMMDTEGASETDARMATERYMAAPGQALAYKIGALKIAELRRRAADALGAGFRLADFHDLVLAEGTLPLQVLEERVMDWIGSRPAACVEPQGSGLAETETRHRGEFLASSPLSQQPGVIR